MPSAEPLFIRTKVRNPGFPDYAVARPRLVEVLVDAGTHPLTLVLGPPGSGKTVAVQQWLHQDTWPNARTAWLSLDQRDDAPSRFWTYALMALERSGAGPFAETQAIVSETNGRGTDLVASLVNEAESSAPVRLILDDLHHVRSQEILDQLAELIEQKPDQLRITATSRSEPAFRLAYWRGAGIVREVREQDLAFTTAEATKLLARLGTDLAAEDVALLIARTEGWAAALQLFALSVSHAASVADVLADVLSGQNEVIAGYLTSEVLQNLPTDVRQFLLETSVLDLFDADTCDAVTGRSDARAILRRLEQENLFLVRVHSRGVYRYHQLFADLIRLEFAATDPDGSRAAGLHRRAAQHFEQNGDLGAAVRHLVDAGDIDAAFTLTVAPAMELWDRGAPNPVARPVLDVFPAAYVRAEPRRIIPYAIALATTGDWAGVRAWLEIGQQSLAENNDPGMEHDLAVAWMTVHLMNGDSERILEAATTPAAPSGSGIPSGNPRLHQRFTPHLARAYLINDEPLLAREVLHYTQPEDAIAREVVLPAVGARVAHRLGELTSALTLAEHSTAAAQALSAPFHPAIADAALAKAGLLIDRGEILTAEPLLELVLDVAERRRAPGYQVLALLDQAQIAASRNEIKDDALSIVAIARRSIQPYGVSGGVQHLIDAVELCLLCEIGDEERATSLAEQLPGPRGLLLRARIDVVFGREEHALQLLDQYHPYCRRDQLEVLLLHAQAQGALGRDPAPTLRDAIALATPEGFVRPFLEHGGTVARLSHATALRSSVQEMRLLGDGIEAALAEPAPTALIEPMTARELEVLRYLPRHLTNEEIARELFVSVNTLKTHVRAIYRKLGVSTRSQAVVHARALHLI